MAQKLINSGHQVTIICGSYDGADTGLIDKFNNGVRRGIVDGIQVIELEIEYSNSQSFLQRTIAFMKYAVKSMGLTIKEDYDLLFATTTPLTAAIPAIFARWFRFKPYIFEVRDLWPELPKEMGVITNPVILGLMSVLEWLAYRNARALVALSPGIKNGIVRKGVNPDKVALIPNGCDISIFGTDDNDLWQPDSIADDDFLAIYSGTHGIANGLDNVLNAAAQLKATGRDNIKIVLIGNGKLKAELVKQAKERELTNVIFLDPVKKSELSKLMRRADVGLQVLANIPAFYYGTSPNKFFDYISAGLPVVTNYPGWIADLISEGNCGKAVPADDAVAFADALSFLSDNRNLLPEMGKNSFTLAKSSFDRELLSDHFVDWLERWEHKH